MTEKTLFIIDPNLLGELSAQGGSELVCSLLRCEATRIGLPPQQLVISFNTSAKDGGIDAKV